MESITVNVNKSMDKAELVVREKLSEEGFGVLTEIDIAATLKEKIGIERQPLKILGVCNPQLAHQVLEIDPSAAMLLPCNVVLQPGANKDSTIVSAVDPRSLIVHPALRPYTEEAASKLSRALQGVSET